MAAPVAGTFMTDMFMAVVDDVEFSRRQGRFEARFAVSGAGLDYHPDWPAAQELAAEGEVLARDLARSSIPVVAVLGNHDYHLGHEEEITRLLVDAGVKVEASSRSPS